MKKLSVTSLVIGALLIVCGIVLITCGFVGYTPSAGMQRYSGNGWRMTMMRYDSSWGLASSSMLSTFITLGVGAIISGLLLFILATLLHVGSGPVGDGVGERPPVQKPPRKRPPQLEAPARKASTEPSASNVENAEDESARTVINLGPPADHE